MLPANGSLVGARLILYANSKPQGTHEGLPVGVSVEDNEAGWRMALGKLALLATTP
jgi:hypothetical protein